MKTENLVILGSTGSIGESTITVVRHLGKRIRVVGLAANSRSQRLAEQAIELGVREAVIADPARYTDLKERLPSTIQAASGSAALIEMVSRPDVDIVLCAIVGTAGLAPVLRAIELGKTIALASKEILVMAGDFVMEAVRKYGAKLIPVDSEHSAIMQCMSGRKTEEVSRLILTASGGPFRGYAPHALDAVTPEMALRHPTWQMGRKITLDSATLMNKALEWIEAGYLFNVDSEQLSVIVHPQSIVHSMVEFVDGTLLAQMGEPDMKSPIQYALTRTEKCTGTLPRFDFTRYPSLTFETLDEVSFPSISFAREALRQRGALPAILNAANESAAIRFFDGEIGFRDIFRIVERTMEKYESFFVSDLNDILAADQAAREFARTLRL